MAALPFRIVDAHLHLWDPYTTPHGAALLVKTLGWNRALLHQVARGLIPRDVMEAIGLPDYVLDRYLPDRYAADCEAFDVETVVHVEAGWHRKTPLAAADETKWLETLPFGQQGSPQLGAIVGYGNPASPWFDDLLARHLAASPRLRGIRCMAAHHPDPGVHRWSPEPGLYTSHAFLRGFERLAEHGLCFDAWVYSTQLSEVAGLAARFPEVPLVIDHLATPVGVFGPFGRSTGKTYRERTSIFEQWRADLADLARHRNVRAKISGLLMPVLGHDFHQRRELAGTERIVDLLTPFVEHAFEVFGTDRLMFGSNFPMDKVTARLPDIVEAHAQMFARHGDCALRAVLRDNAIRFYRLGDRSSAEAAAESTEIRE